MQILEQSVCVHAANTERIKFIIIYLNILIIFITNLANDSKCKLKHENTHNAQ